MNKHLYTIKWSQPYATEYQRPYLNDLQELLERTIEAVLEHGDYTEANKELERIMKL